MKLKVLTYNTLFGGRDGTDDRRARAQIGLINELRPDVFLMQEAKGFVANGSAWLYALEAGLGMRGSWRRRRAPVKNVAIFIREPLRPMSFDVDGANFHHALATLKVAMPDSATPLTLISAHLCPNGASVRRREAAYLGVWAAPEGFTLLAGNFNSASPLDPEPEGFDAFPVHHRPRYLTDDLRTADRSVLAQLEAAGWVDVGHAQGDSGVPTAGFFGTEFAVMLCDYLMASSALAEHATQYQVIRTPVTDAASDHYPVLATFEVAP